MKPPLHPPFALDGPRVGSFAERVHKGGHDSKYNQKSPRSQTTPLSRPARHHQHRRLAKRVAALQHYGMTTLALSKRGSLTLPPALRRKMGLDKLSNPLFLVEERDGGLFLQPAVAMPVRDLPKAKIQAWIAKDEADLEAFRAAGKAKKK